MWGICTFWVGSVKYLVSTWLVTHRRDFGSLEHLYIKWHLLLADFLQFCLLGQITQLTASSNTFFNPRWVNAEHSKYFTALILCAILTPCSFLTGHWPIWASCESVSRSSLRSVLVPTNMIGTSLQWWRISGTHLTRTFSNWNTDRIIRFIFGWTNFVPMEVRQRRNRQERHRSTKNR